MRHFITMSYINVFVEHIKILSVVSCVSGNFYRFFNTWLLQFANAFLNFFLVFKTRVNIFLNMVTVIVYFHLFIQHFDYEFFPQEFVFVFQKNLEIQSVFFFNICISFLQSLVISIVFLSVCNYFYNILRLNLSIWFYKIVRLAIIAILDIHFFLLNLFVYRRF